jgi:hypothetical protein
MRTLKPPYQAQRETLRDKTLLSELLAKLPAPTNAVRKQTA